MERFPASCNTYGCRWCGPVKANAYGQLAAASRPERFLTLTGASADWQENRQRVMNLLRLVRDRGRVFEMFWAVEENPRGTGQHLHGVEHGDYVPQSLLQKLWGAIVHIERIRVEVEASRYVIKGAAASNYVTKGTTADLDAHRARNGGRAAHWTRRYMRLDNGEPQTATALRAALGRSSLSGPWLMVPAHTAVSREDVRRLLTAQLNRRGVMA
jgi:hypothetical protein